MGSERIYTDEELGIDVLTIHNEAIIMGGSVRVVEHVDELRRYRTDRMIRQQRIADTLHNMNISASRVERSPYFVR